MLFSFESSSGIRRNLLRYIKVVAIRKFVVEIWAGLTTRTYEGWKLFLSWEPRAFHGLE